MNLTFHCQTFPTSTSELSARPVMTTEMLKGSYWVTWTVVFSTDSSTFIPALFLSKMFSPGWSCSEILLFIIGMRLNQNMRYITVKFCKIMFNICFKTKICRIHNFYKMHFKTFSSVIFLIRSRCSVWGQYLILSNYPASSRSETLRYSKGRLWRYSKLLLL